MYYQDITFHKHKGSLLLTPTHVVFFFAAARTNRVLKWSWKSIEKTLVNPNKLLIKFVCSQQEGKSITFASKNLEQLEILREDAKRGCAKTHRRRRRLERIERAETMNQAFLLPAVLSQAEREKEAAELALAGHQVVQASDEEWLFKLVEEVKSMNEDARLATWKTELNARATNLQLEEAKEKAEWLLSLEESDDISSLSSVVDDEEYEEETVDEDDEDDLSGISPWKDGEYEDETVDDEYQSCGSSLDDDAMTVDSCSEEEEDLSVWLERELMQPNISGTEQDACTIATGHAQDGEETGSWLEEQDALSREAANAVAGEYQKGSELGDSDDDSSTVSLTSSYCASYTTLDWETEREHDLIFDIVDGA